MRNLHQQGARERALLALRDFRPSFDDKDIVFSLTSALKEFRATLVLGAGVSTTVGLPQWKNLLKDLIDKVCGDLSNPEEFRKPLTEIMDSMPPVILARYLENIGITKSSLANDIRECLYKTYDESLERVQLTPLVESLLTPSGAVRLRNVLTYNFDNSLERCLTRHRIECRAIYSAKTYAEQHVGLRVFHPHGLLPHPSDDPGNIFIEDSHIFSERGYNALFMDVLHWANAVQLHHFSTRRCLFLGISMTDPSIRRLLEFAKTQAGYATPHFTVQCPSSNTLANALLERDLRSLGVRVLWVKAFERIPELLKTLTN